jgi:hypothetical protein
MHVYKPLRLMVYHPGSIYAEGENNGYVVLKLLGLVVSMIRIGGEKDLVSSDNNLQQV